MIIGLGGLGSVVLELLARQDGMGRIIVGSLEDAPSRARCNLTRTGAVTQGYSPVIEFTPLDIDKPATVVDAVHRYRPDLIFSAATMQTWWLPNLLPDEQRTLLKSARYGMWLPIHLTLTLKLMRTLTDSNFEGFTLTAPYPDVINPILGRLGLAPTCGVGNVGEIEPKVRLLAAQQLGAPLEAVDVSLVAHHAMVSVAYSDVPQDIPPYFLRVRHRGEDVTRMIQADELLLSPYPLPPGPATHFLTAASIVPLIRAFFSDQPSRLHAPAPNGLPGGYPVEVSSEGIEPAVIDGLTLDQAVDINERSHPFDGIDSIEHDGTAVFCPESVEIFRDALGYDCDRLPPSEAEERAKELMVRFREYAGRHGVSL